MSKQYINGQLMFDTDYSTSEVKTGATWIDGRPVYCKVVKCTFPSTSGQTATKAHGVADMKDVVDYRVIADTSSPVFYKLPYCSGAAGTPYAIATVDRTNIYVATNISNLLSRDCYATVWYTKTTD